jgi:arginase
MEISMKDTEDTTLRLLFPQWQGGNLHEYHFGAELLAWLAPQTNGPVERVHVPFNEDMILENENGIVGRSQLIPQLAHAKDLINQHMPENIVVLGGDCLVSLLPFAYLSEKYGEDLGVLWIDAHPDIMTSKEYDHSHASVLRALIGEGDEDLTRFVTSPLNTNKIMYAGVNNENDYERNFIKNRGIRVCRPEEITSEIVSIGEWILSENIKVLAIHFDLDVLSTANFGSLYFKNPKVPENDFAGIAQGQLSMNDVLNIFDASCKHADVVGLTIAEHLPWDTLNLKKMLEKLPLLRRAE